MKFVDRNDDVWRGSAGPGPRLLSSDEWPQWRERVLAARASPRALLGVRWPNDRDIEELACDLPLLALVALDFPKWVDGRAYTQARLLRARHRFSGEIRAVGEVLVDMVPLLVRTGFDSAELRADQTLAAAQRALEFFPARERSHYQRGLGERGLGVTVATSGEHS